MKIANNLPIIEWTNIKSYPDKRKAVLFTSPSAYKTTRPYLKGLNLTHKVYIDSVTKEDAENLANKPIKAEVGYAVGGGRVIDVARFLASRWDLEIICIPTIISSDAFLVNCTGLRENGVVTYYPSKRADKVMLDFDLLKETEPRYHLSGCGDVLSIYTALHDWRSSKDNYLPGVAKIANGILDNLLSESHDIKTGTRRGIEALVTSLSMEVQLCNLYGNSRPEEGGEHFFTYCIENKLDHFLHGEMVCFGILITSFIQRRSVFKIKDFMDKVGINYKPKGLNMQIVLETLKEMSNYVKKHSLLESVYNNFSYPGNERKIKRFLKDIFIYE